MDNTYQGIIRQIKRLFVDVRKIFFISNPESIAELATGIVLAPDQWCAYMPHKWVADEIRLKLFCSPDPSTDHCQFKPACLRLSSTSYDLLKISPGCLRDCGFSWIIV